MHPIIAELDIAYHRLNLTDLKRMLNSICRNIRLESDHSKYICVCYANELDRRISIVSHCGLQKDILARIYQGSMSFNKAWTEHLALGNQLTHLQLAPGETPLAKQLDAVFGQHKVLGYFCRLARSSEHEYVVFIEVNHHKATDFVFSAFSDSDILSLSEKLYLAHLKSYKDSHISDWEKAVHELASPLDFIYSNSDFLIYYLQSTALTADQRKKKLEDLRLIADLLLKRLHTF